MDACAAVVDPGAYYNACMFDIAATKDLAAGEASIAAYAQRCIADSTDPVNIGISFIYNSYHIDFSFSYSYIAHLLHSLRTGSRACRTRSRAHLFPH